MNGDGDRRLTSVPAHDVNEGEMLVTPIGEYRLVLRVERYDEETGHDAGPRIRFIVAGGRVQAYDGARSGHAGARGVDVNEQGLRPFKPNELVTVLRAG